jgi:periplasmic nitrate reductase NapD
MIMHSSGLSRRALLKGRLTSRPAYAADEPSIHISSAVVSVLPNRREDIIERLSAIEGIEIHHAESFKIVIVLEAGDSGAIGSRLAEIATWSGVLSANMVFEQAATLTDMGEST